MAGSLMAFQNVGGAFAPRPAAALRRLPHWAASVATEALWDRCAFFQMENRIGEALRFAAVKKKHALSLSSLSGRVRDFKSRRGDRSRRRSRQLFRFQ